MKTTEMGQKVKDKITGFTGVVTARCQYISGCNQSLVQPPVKDDGTFVDSKWFDEDRLEALDAPKVAVEVTNPGFDIPAPIR